VKWFRLKSLEDFPTLGFATPPPIKISTSKEEESSSPLQPIPSYSYADNLNIENEDVWMRVFV